MSKKRDEKIILLVEPKDNIIKNLTIANTKHTIFTCNSGKKAINIYTEFHNKDKDLINLIVFLDTGIKDNSWQNIIKQMIDISLTPSIVVFDYKKDIQRAVEAYSLTALSYEKRDASPGDMLNIIKKVHDAALSPVKFNKAFFKDDVWSRHIRDKQILLVEVKLGSQFEMKLKVKHKNAQKKKDSQKDILELALPYYFENKLTIKTCKKIIELYLGKSLSELNKTKLLIIDDVWEILDKIDNTANKYFKIIMAPDGKTAIKELVKNKDISIALLDMYLPDKNGFELFQDMHKINDLLLVIALTGYTEIAVAEKMIKNGVFDYLNKPFEKKDLLLKLFKAWKRKTWPFFEDKINLQELSFIQRIYFLNYLMKERQRNKELFKDPQNLKKYTKYQLNSELKEIYLCDIYALFPDFLGID